MPDNELCVTEANGKIYVFMRDTRGDPESGYVLSPAAADQLAEALKQKAARARAITIEGQHSRVN